jgi:hypothetical protein
MTNGAEVGEAAELMCEAITAIKQALAAQPAPVQDSTCNNSLREQGKAYPRTCKKCKFGPCIGLANAALDKKAENARELGLDYEPAQRTWVGLTDEEIERVWQCTQANDFHDCVQPFAQAIEAKLKERNA